MALSYDHSQKIVQGEHNNKPSLEKGHNRRDKSTKYIFKGLHFLISKIHIQCSSAAIALAIVLLLAEAAAFSETRLASRGLTEHTATALAFDDCLRVAEHGCDLVTARALDV